MNNSIDGSYWAHFITPFDYVLLPIYLGIVYFIAFRFCNKHYKPGHPWRKIFLFGFSLRICGALFIGFVYEFYYQGGDTSAFFYHAKVINQCMSESFLKWIKLILHIPAVDDVNYYTYISQMAWYNDRSAYFVSTVTAFLSLFTFETFLPTSILFAALSFTGVWAMFRTFAEQYPKLTRPLAVCVLFIPSTFVWGSGIFKDTICLSALGWLTFASFRMLVKKRFEAHYIIIAIVSFYMLVITKVYIALVYVPSLLLWIVNTYSQKIRISGLRFVTKTIVYVVIIIGFFAVTSFYSKELGQYSVENLAKTSNTTRSYIYYVSTQVTRDEEPSAYSLGDFDPTIGGMLKKFPAAVNVTLFRPYIWEAKKAMIFLNSIEALLFLFFTLKVIFSVGPRRAWLAIAGSPIIQFFLVFTIIFAFAVGISSYNFGALSRYRIPCLPFYAMALIMIYYKYNSPNKFFFKFRFS